MTVKESIHLYEIHVVLAMLRGDYVFMVGLCTRCDIPWHLCDHGQATFLPLSRDAEIELLVRWLEADGL